MPKTVIFLTIAAAITGQAVGARLERKRMAWLADNPQSADSQQAVQSVSVPAPVPAVATGQRVADCRRATAEEVDQQNPLTSLASSFLHSRQPIVHAM